MDPRTRTQNDCKQLPLTSSISHGEMRVLSPPCRCGSATETTRLPPKPTKKGGATTKEDGRKDLDTMKMLLTTKKKWIIY